MILGLDHIAIVHPDLDEAIRRFVEDLGLPFEGVEDVPQQQTRTAFLPVTDAVHHARIELVSPIDGQGPLARHLDRRGPGLHHICFRTDDIEGDIARLKARGYELTTDGPTPGAHGTRVVFVHPRSTGGVLIELAEYPEDARGADRG